VKSTIHNAIIASGCEVEGANVEKSVLGYRVRFAAGSSLNESILLGKVHVGNQCQLHKVIADKDVVIAPNMHIGFDHKRDMSRGLTVTDTGVTVIPKGMVVGY
jgi:glucose-1-phosphate adenylyltransferase